MKPTGSTSEIPSEYRGLLLVTNGRKSDFTDQQQLPASNSVFPRQSESCVRAPVDPEAPEIYISEFSLQGKRKLSSLNAAIKNIKLPEAERVYGRRRTECSRRHAVQADQLHRR